MRAAFAIQVKTGREHAVKKLVEWAFDRHETARKWVKAVHAFTQGTAKMLDENGRLGKRRERSLIPGYIFVEMNYFARDDNYTAYLPNELWHLVKSVPGVLKLFADAGQIIGAETFHDLFEKLEPKTSEDQVEVTTPDTTQQEETDLITACTTYNESRTVKEKRKAEQLLNRIEMMRLLYRQALDKLASVYRNGRYIVRVSRQVFDITISRLSQPLSRPELIKQLSMVMIN